MSARVVVLTFVGTVDHEPIFDDSTIAAARAALASVGIRPVLTEWAGPDVDTIADATSAADAVDNPVTHLDLNNPA